MSLMKFSILVIKVFLPNYFHFHNFQIAQIRPVLIDVSAAHLGDIQTMHHTQPRAQPALHTTLLMKPIEHVVSAF